MVPLNQNSFIERKTRPSFGGADILLLAEYDDIGDLLVEAFDEAGRVGRGSAGALLGTRLTAYNYNEL